MDFWQSINQNYAGVLSLIVSIITAIITCTYVIFTYQQMKATQLSVEIMGIQLSMDKQPCLIPIIIDGASNPAMSNGRRFLTFDIDIANEGTFAALSVITICCFELKHITNSKDSNIIMMSSTPEYVPYISIGDTKKIQLSFENKEIEYLLKDLTITQNKNWKRIIENPEKNHVRGSNLIVKVFCKNVLGQWFQSTLTQEIAWLIDKNAPKRKTNNINENTIPPKELRPDMEVRICFGWLNASPVDIKPIDGQDVKRQIEKYSESRPEILEHIIR